MGPSLYVDVMTAHHLADVTLAVDAGVVSAASRRVIEAVGLSFILGARIGWPFRKSVRTARCYRAAEIQADAHTITAADPLPKDLRQARQAIRRVGPVAQRDQHRLGPWPEPQRRQRHPARNLPSTRTPTPSCTGRT